MDLYLIISRRFQSELFLGKDSTLTYRFDAINATFKNYSIFKYLFGTGWTSTYELEMFLPNYLFKYGILGMIIIFCVFYSDLLKKIFEIRNVIYLKKILIYIFIIISLGGLISGFGGAPGQLFIGMILGIISNKNLD